MLRIDKLKVAPLPPLSFSVSDGECLLIEGPSGSGKTRLLRAIADLDPAPGHAVLNGIERHEIPAPEWRRKVRYAAAEPAWWTDTARPAFTVQHAATAGRLQRLLLSLALNETVLDQPLATLSTGERQRLALARALIDEPAVLLLDEPVSALDLQSAALVAELLRFQMLAGRTLVITAHDDNPVTRLAHARLQLARTPGSARPPSNSEQRGPHMKGAGP